MSRPSATEDVFRAVADPTRRAVLETLLRFREIPVTELADRLEVTMPMLSRHLAVLRHAGLVRERRAGRQRLYSIQPQPLQDLFDWASLFSEFWSERLKGLHDYLDRQTTTMPSHPEASSPPEPGEPDNAT
ncbi:metalloregulator ArsR/SmtB family transcription factor [Kribbella sp. NPDC026611]|uniref:ArsR/SmtB family transcription factor n=1 Tax=Kribbella sp. NPDC026611 TaxID=3154911 RepID=UPI0033E0DF56